MKTFVIMSTYFNGSQYLVSHLTSVIRQMSHLYRVIHYITDDCSTDNCHGILHKYFEELPEELKNYPNYEMLYIRNTEKLYQNGNYQSILSDLKIRYPEEWKSVIAVELDGDDKFSNHLVLRDLNILYEDPEVWMTHGGMRFWNPSTVEFTEDEGKRFNRPIKDLSTLRDEKMYFFHLRSWRIFLQDLIQDDHLKDPKTSWYYESGGDTAFFIPMIEMSGVDRIKLLDFNAVDYNNQNPLNDFKLDYDKQKQLNMSGMKDHPRYSLIP